MEFKFTNHFKKTMTKYILTTIIILFSVQALSQKKLANIFIRSTVYLKYDSGGSASGVIVADSSFIYLVTARHCFFNESKNGKINLIDSLAYLIYYALMHLIVNLIH